MYILSALRLLRARSKCHSFQILPSFELKLNLRIVTEYTEMAYGSEIKENKEGKKTIRTDSGSGKRSAPFFL
jgi:hypothetical protein